MVLLTFIAICEGLGFREVFVPSPCNESSSLIRKKWPREALKEEDFDNRQRKEPLVNIKIVGTV